MISAIGVIILLSYHISENIVDKQNNIYILF